MCNNNLYKSWPWCSASLQHEYGSLWCFVPTCHDPKPQHNHDNV